MEVEIVKEIVAPGHLQIVDLQRTGLSMLGLRKNIFSNGLKYIRGRVEVSVPILHFEHTCVIVSVVAGCPSAYERHAHWRWRCGRGVRGFIT